MKSLFEEMGGTYRQVGDYLIPNLILPAQKEMPPLGKYGRMRRHFLKEHRRILYTNLLTSGKLYTHLAGTEEQAQEMFLWLIKQLAESEGVNEQLKAADQMEWVRQMNNIRNRAAEIVNAEVIFI